MKVVLTVFLLLVCQLALAADIALCSGTVLQRRVALVRVGQLADAYIAAKGALPDICSAPVAGVSDKIPRLLQNASTCGSSKESAVYYSCQLPVGQSDLPSGDAPVVEACRYSLIDQSVSCENRSVVTTFAEPNP